jgi:hypothetical protein
VGLRCYLPHADAHWFAADFAAAGLRDGRGQKPTAETARLT